MHYGFGVVLFLKIQTSQLVILKSWMLTLKFLFKWNTKV
jgi:hypothetical protein